MLNKSILIIKAFFIPYNNKANHQKFHSVYKEIGFLNNQDDLLSGVKKALRLISNLSERHNLLILIMEHYK